MQRLVVLLMIAFLSIPNLLAVDPPCPPPDPMWPRICQTSWVYFDCSDDGVDNHCIIEYEWCYQVKVDYYGNVTDRNITILSYYVYDESLCSCFDHDGDGINDYEMEILLSIFSHTTELKIEDTDPKAIKIFSAPCWKEVFRGWEECDHSSCCEVDLNVKYTGTYDQATGTTIFTIAQVTNQGSSSPIVSCDAPCFSACTRWFYTNDDWADRIADDGLNPVTTDIQPLPRKIQVDNEKTINNYKDESSSKIYPNPSSGEVTIKIDNIENQILNILLTDLSGKTVFSANDVQYISSEGIKFDISNLAQGTYIYKVYNGEDIVTRGKVIKE